MEDVLLDIETTLNNRPLTYLEDDIQYPVLTPNIMLHTWRSTPWLHSIPVKPLDEGVGEVSQKDIRTRWKYILKWKNAACARWTKEYRGALRERHNMIQSEKQRVPTIGEIVLIKGDEKNGGANIFQQRWCCKGGEDHIWRERYSVYSLRNFPVT